jgi:hypothetical protein
MKRTGSNIVRSKPNTRSRTISSPPRDPSDLAQTHRSQTPNTDYVALLDARVHDVMVRSGQDVREVDGFLIGDLVRDLETVDIPDRDFDPFGLSTGVSSCEMAVPEEPGVGLVGLGVPAVPRISDTDQGQGMYQS